MSEALTKSAMTGSKFFVGENGMVDRYLKILMCVIIGAMALTYVTHNFANLGEAHAFFTYVTSHEGQEAYPVTLFPVPPNALIIAAMVLVFSLEVAAGVLLWLGAWRMWNTRGQDAASFNGAKRLAKIGLGCAIANWWGLFQVIAIAGYQLWQMPGGQGPDHGSWVFGAMSMMVLIYLSMRESEA
jgi:predicted small integral membrane protein